MVNITKPLEYHHPVTWSFIPREYSIFDVWQWYSLVSITSGSDNMEVFLLHQTGSLVAWFLQLKAKHFWTSVADSKYDSLSCYLLRSLVIRFWNSEEIPLLKLGRESNRSVCLSGGCLSVWWLGCLWRCGLRRAMLMSFRRRGNGPSLIMASLRRNKLKQRKEPH